MTLRRWTAAALAVLTSGLCSADVVELDNGSRLVGTVELIKDGKLTIVTDFAGPLTLDYARVRGLSTEAPVTVAFQSGNRLVGTVSWAEDSLQVETVDGTMTVKADRVVAAWEPSADDPLAPVPPAPPAPAKWSYEASFDLSGKTGNSERLSYGGGVKALRSWERDKLLFYARGRWAEENQSKSEDEIVAGLDFESRIGKRHSWYARTEYETDDIENLDLRATAALGYGYYFKDSPDHAARGRIGFLYRHQAFEGRPAESDPGVDLGFYHMIKIRDWGKLTSDLTYTPSLEDLADWRAFHESALDVPLAGPGNWRLRLGVTNDYYSLPAPGKERLDTVYFARLVLSWE